MCCQSPVYSSTEASHPLPQSSASGKVSIQVPSPWAPRGKPVGHCTALCLHSMGRGHRPLPSGLACCICRVNSSLGVSWITNPAACSGTLPAHSPSCLPHALRLYQWTVQHNTGRSVSKTFGAEGLLSTHIFSEELCWIDCNPVPWTKHLLLTGEYYVHFLRTSSSLV